MSGDAGERSRRYGELARQQILITRRGYERAFAAKGVDWARATAQARAYMPAIERHLPGLLDEIRGIAEGSGLAFEEILTINCRSEILHAATVAKAGRIIGECTSFALEPDRTASGETVLGQNWDWLEFLSDATILLEVEREDGPNYATLVEAGLLAKMILTESGLAIGINTLATSLDGTADRVPFHFVIRSLADSPHIAGALERVAGVPRAASGNYILANADGAVLNFETSPGGPRNVTPQIATTGAVVHANHFVDPVPGGHDLAPLAMADSFVRFGRMTRRVARAEDRLSDEDLRAALADHAEWPNSVCCHPDPAGGPDERWTTIASVVMHPARRALAFTVGPPCENAWHEIDYRELLA
ncbi:C45 family autoproteolytic acyltransferase/hydolase [Leucobacter soli]|uniref:C45 family autoproteolytic acyltransferase/hydolase n=1 Tax=Leucobacter soli TaxID=2812850 RepID=UPI00361047D3